LNWKRNKYDTKSFKSNYLHVRFGSILGGSIAIHGPEDALVPPLSFSEFGEEVVQSKSSVNELDMNENQDTVGSNRKSNGWMGQDGRRGLEGFRFIHIDHLRHTATNLRLSTELLRKASFFPFERLKER
jgi:hypothetical protein